MLLIYVHKSSPRLQYISSFIFKELLKTAYAITADKKNFKDFDGVKLNYSDEVVAEDEIRIPNTGFLWETGIKTQQLNISEYNGNKTLFSSTSDQAYPFDIFSACFYLVSRYEEYLPHEKDRHGRFSHKSSIAWQENFLHQPLVNIWSHDLAEHIHNKFPSWNYGIPAFNFIPTYDVDMAWSYLNKGLVRNAGGAVRSLLTLKIGSVFQQLRTLTGAKDPADNFSWLDELHEKYSLNPIYFFLVAQKNGTYDKNILPSSKPMKKLIKKIAAKYITGLHPSYQSSENPSIMLEEKEILENISGHIIDTSRNHYLRLTLPVGYRKLIEADIQHDHTMGYATTNGFRASVASSFYWYDIENEVQTKLHVHPFCYMDSLAVNDRKVTRDQALNELKYFFEICKEVNGTFIPVLHNHLLAMKYWPDLYEEFLATVNY